MERLTVYTPDGYESINPVDLCLDEYSGINFERILDKLGKYEDFEEQGLLLRLPCKIGDTVWDNDFGRTVGFEVTGFSFGDMNEDYCDDEVKVFNQIIVYYKNSKGSVTGSFAVSDIGKTVFLTKSEAEAKLKELRCNND